MTVRSCLLVVADYPYVNVDGRVFAEIPWDETLASLYAPAFDRILLLGRYRSAAAPPPGWFVVDERFYEVLDGGDWERAIGCLGNMPKLFRALRANWRRIGVVYLKLFYLHSLIVWAYNRLRPQAQRKPVASLLVGDAADAILLRNDLLPWSLARRAAAGVVAGSIRFVQRRVALAGFWAQFLADKFGRGLPHEMVVNESWLHAEQIRAHDRRGPRRPATILFVGRLISRKRPNHLLTAIGRLVGERQDVHCVLVGDGPERGALEQQARTLAISDRVTFTGWLGLLTPQMLKCYDDADVFCLPSFAEGVPLVVVEAMGRGVAVVATAVSGTPEAVDHERNGLLVPRDDVDALTSALRRMLTEPVLWRRCVEAGYAVARRNTFEAQRGRLARAIMELAP